MGQESLLTQFHLSASEFKRWLPQFYSLDGPWQGTRMGAVGINMRAGVRSCHLGISNSCKLIFKECWCTFISSAASGKASFFFILSFSYERFFTENHRGVKYQFGFFSYRFAPFKQALSYSEFFSKGRNALACIVTHWSLQRSSKSKQ